ncbi:hypothetical protein FKW77_006368 [Venturia effusa]|uniref:Uncharacterized protein n=1 Tax=Venturia effusa TaxID=50376 RepID=A0A517LDW1_9PEZI|nr:hypothetical protein FKW77_006368 [Venturia effusa]
MEPSHIQKQRSAQRSQPTEQDSKPPSDWVTIALIGTLDTKLEELLYLRKEIKALPHTEVILIDVGRHPTAHAAISISHLDLFFRYGTAETPESTSDLPRNEVLDVMSTLATACVRDLYHQKKIQGIVSAGGSGGTALAATVMRDALPIGFPKLILSTVASGDTGPIVGETDVTLMYSVVDISGLNSLLKTVLSNAAGSIVGMARTQLWRSWRESTETARKAKFRIGITMFGVTTPCVDTVRKHITEKLPESEVYIFHATGHGGLAMERLINEGKLDAVLDITTTEICDVLFGGNMSAGPQRLEAGLKMGIPYIISLGATNMVNFGPKDTSVPDKYKERNLLVHNANVTLMRTSETECRQVGDFVVEKLRKFVKNPDKVQVWIPNGGVSLIDTSGGPFEDSKANEALFDTVRVGLRNSGVKIVEREENINDEGFAVGIADEVLELLRTKNNP